MRVKSSWQQHGDPDPAGGGNLFIKQVGEYTYMIVTARQIDWPEGKYYFSYGTIDLSAVPDQEIEDARAYAGMSNFEFPGAYFTIEALNSFTNITLYERFSNNYWKTIRELEVAS